MVREIGIRGIVTWALSLFFILFGLLGLLAYIPTGILILLGGLLISPSLNSFLKSKFNIVLSSWLKGIGLIGLTFLSIMIYPSSPLPPNEYQLEQQQPIGIVELIEDPSVASLALSDFGEAGWTKDEEKIGNNSYFLDFYKDSGSNFELIENNIESYPSPEDAKNVYLTEKKKISESHSIEEVDIGDGGFLYKPISNELYIIFVDKNLVISLGNYKQYGSVSKRFNSELASKIDKKIGNL